MREWTEVLAAVATILAALAGVYLARDRSSLLATRVRDAEDVRSAVAANAASSESADDRAYREAWRTRLDYAEAAVIAAAMDYDEYVVDARKPRSGETRIFWAIGVIAGAGSVYGLLTQAEVLGVILSLILYVFSVIWLSRAVIQTAENHRRRSRIDDLRALGIDAKAWTDRPVPKPARMRWTSRVLARFRTVPNKRR